LELTKVDLDILGACSREFFRNVLHDPLKLGHLAQGGKVLSKLEAIPLAGVLGKMV